jgi:hypothetical protein
MFVKITAKISVFEVTILIAGLGSWPKAKTVFPARRVEANPSAKLTRGKKKERGILPPQHYHKKGEKKKRKKKRKSFFLRESKIPNHDSDFSAL